MRIITALLCWEVESGTEMSGTTFSLIKRLVALLRMGSLEKESCLVLLDVRKMYQYRDWYRKQYCIVLL